MTTDIIEILSSAKAPKKDGYGNEFRNCSRPFVNASMTNGRKAILKMLEWQEAWDLVIRQIQAIEHIEWARTCFVCI